jgi:hypothetical protein
VAVGPEGGFGEEVDGFAAVVLGVKLVWSLSNEKSFEARREENVSISLRRC